MKNVSKILNNKFTRITSLVVLGAVTSTVLVNAAIGPPAKESAPDTTTAAKKISVSNATITTPQSKQTTNTSSAASSQSKPTATTTPSSFNSPATYTPPACDQSKKQYYENQYATAYAQETDRHQLAVASIENAYGNSSYEAKQQGYEDNTYQNNVAGLKNTLNYELETINCSD